MHSLFVMNHDWNNCPVDRFMAPDLANRKEEFRRAGIIPDRESNP